MKPNRSLLRRAAHLLRFAFCLSFLAGCETLDQVMTPMLMMSPEQEQQASPQVRAEVEKGLTFVHDPALVNYVRRIGQMVKTYAPQKAAVQGEFFVVQDPSINAFAIPGGNIYVHTGLLAAANDDAEVAGVLAHEYGHVCFRHGAKHMSRAMGMDMVQQLVLGENAGQVAQAVGGLVAQGALTSYSRQDELEADSVAVPTLYNAGLDPNAMVSFFETMQGKGGGGNPGLMVYFSSHPATGDRIARVRAQIAQFVPREPVRPMDELRRVQARMQDLGLLGK